jgi:hypothetical protein
MKILNHMSQKSFIKILIIAIAVIISAIGYFIYFQRESKIPTGIEAIKFGPTLLKIQPYHLQINQIARIEGINLKGKNIKIFVNEEEILEKNIIDFDSTHISFLVPENAHSGILTATIDGSSTNRLIINVQRKISPTVGTPGRILLIPDLCFYEKQPCKTTVTTKMPVGSEITTYVYRLDLDDGKLAPLHDDGKNGDEYANDGLYTAVISFDKEKLGEIPLQVFNDAETHFFSEKVYYRIWREPFSTPANDKDIVNNCAINQLIISLPEATDRDLAEIIANSVRAEIIGHSPGSSSYSLLVPTSTLSDLELLQKQLENDPRVEIVNKNYRMQLN